MEINRYRTCVGLWSSLRGWAMPPRHNTPLESPVVKSEVQVWRVRKRVWGNEKRVGGGGSGERGW